jgi:hypothetical protein
MAIRRGCSKPFDENIQGCTRVVNLTDDGRGIYDLWYVSNADLIHEECHAYYEEWRHIIFWESLEGL